MVVGDTDNVAPVPTCVPPQPPVYHTQFGAEFRAPPLTWSVVDCPKFIVVWLAVALVGETGGISEFTVIVTDLQVVVVSQAEAWT